MANNDLKRHRLLQRQNWRCCWCGEALSRPTATLEHILPEVMGGTEAYENTAVAHQACNVARGHNIWQDPAPSFLFDFVRERLSQIRFEGIKPDGPLPKDTPMPIIHWTKAATS